MRATVPVASTEASKAVAELRGTCPTSSESVAPFDIVASSRKDGPKWFPGLAKLLSRDKPAAAIHHLTSEAERTCYDWCKGAVDPPSRALIKLLHTNVGWTVLEYIMRGCPQPWWREVQRARRCARAFDSESDQYQLGL